MGETYKAETIAPGNGVITHVTVAGIVMELKRPVKAMAGQVIHIY